jgi:Protein of unknown function (DUF1525).
MKKLILAILFAPSMALTPPVWSAEEQISSIELFTIDGFSFDMESKRLTNLINVPVTVRRVDYITQLEAELSANLPPDEEKALAIANQRLAKKNINSIVDQSNKTVDAMTIAREIGVTKIPAVVFNRKWIVYGENPLRAYQIYQEKLESNTLRAGEQ